MFCTRWMASQSTSIRIFLHGICSWLIEKTYFRFDLVENIFTFRRFFSSLWFDVFKNLTCLSNLYITRSSITSFESSLIHSIWINSNTKIFHLAFARSSSHVNLFVSLCNRFHFHFLLAIIRSTFSHINSWISKKKNTSEFLINVKSLFVFRFVK